MNAAPEWRRFEEEYSRYGLDMQPEDQKIRKEQQKEKRKKEAVKPELKVTAHDKAVMMVMIGAIAFCMLAMIFFHAYAANINYKISSLNQQIESVNDDIDNLNVQLKTAGSLDQIEAYAESNLGMGYPTNGNNVDVTDLENTEAVDSYIASLTAAQRGITADAEVTAADAAKKLFDRG